MIRVALLLALLVRAATAQTTLDAGLVETCLAQAEPSSRSNCIGRAAEACMAEPGTSSTVGMTECLGLELTWWDHRLNRAYALLMELERESGAELRAVASAASDPAEALRDMQRAWIGWRDAACFYERSQWGGGTGGGPAYQDCAMRMTAEQALDLDNRLAARRGH